MQQHMHYQIELAGTAATLYIAGQLGAEDIPRITHACRALPAHFRTLRVDMRAMHALTAEALGAVRALLHDWRDRREGEYRLRSGYLVVTCAETGAMTPDLSAATLQPRGERRPRDVRQHVPPRRW
ncbi:MAG TPA: hypothetical protein VFN39_00030 [Gemmatimonadaceae bacterium]|nr:hypothetical protein [Gemmatimonadaceae bacterium]